MSDDADVTTGSAQPDQPRVPQRYPDLMYRFADDGPSFTDGELKQIITYARSQNSGLVIEGASRIEDVFPPNLLDRINGAGGLEVFEPLDTDLSRYGPVDLVDEVTGRTHNIFGGDIHSSASPSTVDQLPHGTEGDGWFSRRFGNRVQNTRWNLFERPPSLPFVPKPSKLESGGKTNGPWRNPYENVKGWEAPEVTDFELPDDFDHAALEQKLRDFNATPFSSGSASTTSTGVSALASVGDGPITDAELDDAFRLHPDPVTSGATDGLVDGDLFHAGDAPGTRAVSLSTAQIDAIESSLDRDRVSATEFRERFIGPDATEFDVTDPAVRSQIPADIAGELDRLGVPVVDRPTVATADDDLIPSFLEDDLDPDGTPRGDGAITDEDIERAFSLDDSDATTPDAPDADASRGDGAITDEDVDRAFSLDGSDATTPETPRSGTVEHFQQFDPQDFSSRGVTGAGGLTGNGAISGLNERMTGISDVQFHADIIDGQPVPTMGGGQPPHPIGQPGSTVTTAATDVVDEAADAITTSASTTTTATAGSGWIDDIVNKWRISTGIYGLIEITNLGGTAMADTFAEQAEGASNPVLREVYEGAADTGYSRAKGKERVVEAVNVVGNAVIDSTDWVGTRIDNAGESVDNALDGFSDAVPDAGIIAGAGDVAEGVLDTTGTLVQGVAKAGDIFFNPLEQGVKDLEGDWLTAYEEAVAAADGGPATELPAGVYPELFNSERFQAYVDGGGAVFPNQSELVGWYQSIEQADPPEDPYANPEPFLTILDPDDPASSTAVAADSPPTPGDVFDEANQALMLEQATDENGDLIPHPTGVESGVTPTEGADRAEVARAGVTPADEAVAEIVARVPEFNLGNTTDTSTRTDDSSIRARVDITPASDPDPTAILPVHNPEVSEVATVEPVRAGPEPMAAPAWEPASTFDPGPVSVGMPSEADILAVVNDAYDWSTSEVVSEPDPVAAGTTPEPVGTTPGFGAMDSTFGAATITPSPVTPSATSPVKTSTGGFVY